MSYRMQIKALSGTNDLVRRIIKENRLSVRPYLALKLPDSRQRSDRLSRMLFMSILNYLALDRAQIGCVGLSLCDGASRF